MRDKKEIEDRLTKANKKLKDQIRLNNILEIARLEREIEVLEWMLKIR